MLRELENMCMDDSFDIARAEELLKTIDINQEFISSKHQLPDTFLDLAACSANIKMVKLLLEKGADPNLIYDNGSENVLWNLQYADGINDSENNLRLEIVKLLLEHGANPRLKIEEELLNWAICYNIEEDEGIQREYRGKFICLLEDYDK